METSPVRMYESSREDQADEKENVVLRSLVGDSNRHKPLVSHTPPPINSFEDNQPASMYTLETRYQPTQSRVLPKNVEPKVYYIGSKQAEEPPFVKEDRNIPFPAEPGKPSSTPIVFLEPKVVSQPILYSVVGAKNPSTTIQSTPIKNEPASPTLYSITGRARRPTVDMSLDNLEVATPIINQSPTLYSMVGSPRRQKQSQEPIKQLLPPTPNLYTILGNPARTSRGIQVDTLDHIPPAPVLYSVVGNTQAPTNIPKENRPPPPQTTVTKQIVEKPTLYTLVGKPYSPPQESMTIRTRPPARKKTPPPPQIATVTTRRFSRSLDRKPEARAEEVLSHPVTKTKGQSQSKESTTAKPETVIIPFREEERRPRPHQPQTLTQYQQLQLPDYNTSHAYRTQKPYRERKYNNNPLPVVSNNRSERKPKPPLYEPRYRVERHHPYVTSQATSFERNPVNTKSRPLLWDNGYQTQTDDDEEYERKMNKNKSSYGKIRPRAPWIPVW